MMMAVMSMREILLIYMGFKLSSLNCSGIIQRNKSAAIGRYVKAAFFLNPSDWKEMKVFTAP